MCLPPLRTAVAALALLLTACDSTTDDVVVPPSGTFLDALAGSYSGQLTTVTRVQGQPDSTITRPLAVTVAGGAAPTITLDPGALAGELDPPALVLTGSYTATGARLRFPGEPPLILDVTEGGALSGGGEVELFGGNLDVDATGQVSAPTFSLSIAALVLEDLPSAPEGSTQTITMQATR